MQTKPKLQVCQQPFTLKKAVKRLFQAEAIFHYSTVSDEWLPLVPRLLDNLSIRTELGDLLKTNIIVHNFTDGQISGSRWSCTRDKNKNQVRTLFLTFNLALTRTTGEWGHDKQRDSHTDLTFSFCYQLILSRGNKCHNSREFILNCNYSI